MNNTQRKIFYFLIFCSSQIYFTTYSVEETSNTPEEKYEYLIKNVQLKNCLINNASTEKTPSGIPKGCEEYAILFAVAAGNEAELKKLTNLFTKYSGL